MEQSPDLNKAGEDFISLPASDSPADGTEKINNHSSSNQPTEADSELSGHENGQPILAAGNEPDSVISSTTMQVSVEVNESISITETRTSAPTENGSALQGGSSPGSHKRSGSPFGSHELNAISGVKRPRITVDEQQASVHVVYNSLTRESKRKLEELLQKWSEWHARHHSSFCDSKGELESGEGTYFPALDVGLDKPSALSFWMDGQTRNSQSKELAALDNNSIPLYDRGCSFGLTSTDGSSNVNGVVEIVDASRCFNCGSYSHALKECPKPRDNAAVNSARKQHKGRRNHNSISRNPTRYYQDTPGGKFDGLRPGVLDPETRKLLGLGEIDPPPWLNRMREMGYPPGYLDPEDEDQPSGIQIFGDDEVMKQETEDGEILDTDCPCPPPEPPRPDPRKKMTVQFPGVNAPIPENADEWRWGARAWKFDVPRNRPNNRSYNPIEPTTKPYHHEERWARDDGPPGVEPGTSPLPSNFSPRFTDHDSRTPGYGRSLSERGKRSPLVHEPSSNHDDDRWSPYPTDFLSHRKDRHEERRHHGRR